MTAPVLTDVGLGTAYERRAVYGLVDEWLGGEGLSTALEGPVDGMAGIAGLHLLPLARRGTRVTVVVPPDAADPVRTVYAERGLSDRLEILDALPTGRTFDAVLSYSALPLVADWRAYLGDVVSRASRLALVTIANPHGWGVVARKAMRLFERDRRVEAHEHESSRPGELERALSRHGRVTGARWLDCPWWPDLHVDTGETLAGATARRLGLAPRERPPRFVYDALRFPHEGPGDAELDRVLARHPGFDGVDRPWVRRFAHHRAVRVDVTPPVGAW